MELNISEAAIEVTRKCNMQCEHCLRGPVQRKTISNHHIYRFLSLIDSIGTLNITGGEPTLAMDTLEHLRHSIIYQDCEVQNFFMVTNGKAINCERLAEWAYHMKLACSDNEISSIGFSFDQFHTSTFNWKQLEKRDRNFYKLSDIMEMEYGITGNEAGGSFIHKHSDKSWNYGSLISEGRSKDFGSRDNRIELFEEDNWNESVSFSEGLLYLSANGNIIAGCNWSYQSEDYKKDIKIAHIDELCGTDDLIDAIRDYNKRVEKSGVLELV